MLTFLPHYQLTELNLASVLFTKGQKKCNLKSLFILFQMIVLGLQYSVTIIILPYVLMIAIFGSEVAV